VCGVEQTFSVVSLCNTLSFSILYTRVSRAQQGHTPPAWFPSSRPPLCSLASGTSFTSGHRHGSLTSSLPVAHCSPAIRCPSSNLVSRPRSESAAPIEEHATEILTHPCCLPEIRRKTQQPLDKANMGWPQCNSTLEDMTIVEDTIWHDYTFHQVGRWICAISGLIATVVSLSLIFMHATHYIKPWEQRHIIRILFMVPVYSVVSFLSFVYYKHSVYFEVLGDCYEAFAIASFFSLLCSYLAKDLHEQKNYFRNISPIKPWVWPMRYFQKCCGGERGPLRTPRSGLTWFNVRAAFVGANAFLLTVFIQVIWVCIFQYCFIRVFMTIVAVGTQTVGLYCLESLNPAFSHVWVMVIEAIAVTVAMYCLIQFYWQIGKDIQQHKPLLKVAAIKLVIFLSFWQTIVISLLTSTGAIKASKTIASPDIKVGIPSMLLCIEMAIFAIFHLWAFSWRPYSMKSAQYNAGTVPGEEPGPRKKHGGPLGLYAMVDAFNPWDFVKAVGRAGRWLFKGRKTRHDDVSYEISRKNAQGSDIALEGQKLTTNVDLSMPTGYSGSSRPDQIYKPSRYAGGEAGEGENLLANSQSMPMSRPPVVRSVTDQSDEYDTLEGDIGAIPSAARPRDESSSHQQAYQAYHQTGRQETGIVAAPYPGGQHEPSHNGRLSMPSYAPPPGHPRSRDQGTGNFF